MDFWYTKSEKEIEENKYIIKLDLDLVGEMMKKKITIIFFSFILIILVIFLFLLYGPYSGFRSFFITTSMTTMNHRYLAHVFYSDEVIYKVMSENNIIEDDGSNSISSDRNEFLEYEKQIISGKKNGRLYKLIEIDEGRYNGYLVAIYDPSKVFVATSKYLGEKGEDILTVSKREKSIVSINASGFYDPNWDSNGGIPHGTVISNGKVVSDYDDALSDGGFIGFNYENRLVLGKWTKEEAIANGLRDAVEFGPFLIVNGNKSYVNGNGGYGVAPRTAIGQREDGVVLFLVINGRSITSIGASMNDLIEIMERYGAYNAANLDGGSSSELVVKGKIINRPVAGSKYGLRDIPVFFVVKDNK